MADAREDALAQARRDASKREAEIAESFPYALTPLQRMYLFTRSETLYGGSNQVQRNIISERALGLPREPRPV